MQPAAKVKARVPDGLIYPFTQPPPAGVVQEVAAGVFWLRMPLPFALEHINLWLLADGDGWTIVDCGFGSHDTRALWEQLFAHSLAGKPVTRIIVTHFHPDHFGLAAWLAERWQAPVFMTAPEFASAQGWFTSGKLYQREAIASLFELHGLAAGGAQDLHRENLFKRGVPALPSVVTALDDGQPLTINGRTWRVINGYGHSPEHAALYCAELGTLISGDMVLPRISTIVSVQPHAPDDDPLGLFLDSLTRYAQLDAETLVLPSHGLPFYGLRERVAALKQHHAVRLNELLAACSKPQTGAQVMPVIFKRALDAQQTLFAMGETLSHINYLHRRGQLACARGDDGIYRYARV
jgi:glyoxylase-like metal-dependent hydrolase (beta-lactamase superfamily II)